MKKILLSALVALACSVHPQNLSAQSFLKNLFGGGKSETTSTTTENNNSTSSTSSEALGGLLNTVVGAATGSTGDSQTGNLISSLISSVTGSVTTTKANLIGSWGYTAPCVQFVSENALSNIGGDVMAGKVEDKLASIYKIIGIKEGTLVFRFAEDGTVSYGIGSRMMQGTYVFNSDEKTVVITTSLGREITTHCTISGSTLALTLDATKLLDLFKGIVSKVSSLQTIATLAEGYTGMKVGFEFSKQ